MPRRRRGSTDEQGRGESSERRGGRQSSRALEPRLVLADVIQSHYVPCAGRTRAIGEPRPRLRVQDWHVVEEVAIGDTDYVLLCRSKGQKTGFESLTARERDALRHASSGASNKEIAHRMGIRPSTVGVLFWRASRKLGALDREDLLRTFMRLSE